MISLLYQYLFYTKKQLIFLSIVGLIIIALSLLTYNGSSYHEQMLYRDIEQLYYHQSHQRLYLWLLPFLYQMILMDHDQPFMKPLDVYFGKDYMLLFKILFYLIVLSWMTLLFFILYHLLPIIWTKYYVLNDLNILFFINLLGDGIIIMHLSFLLIRQKYQTFSFMIPIFYLLYTILLEDLNTSFMYYLFPIYLPIENVKSVAFIYKLCYILVGFILIFLQSSKKTSRIKVYS